MSEQPQSGPRPLSVAQAAAEVGYSAATVIGWIEAGHLAAFVPPGRAVADGRPGRKDYRIRPADLDAFRRAHTVVHRPGEAATKARPLGAAAGTDGIDRLRRRRKG